MDISNALIAKSDQLNASDLTGSPRTVVILEVKQGNPEQPVNIITDVFGDKRPFKPSKTVLRILAEAWGLETSAWVGNRMELFRDPKVRWAGEEVGGIRVKAISNIAQPQTSVLLESKGKYAKHTVQPLKAEAPKPTAAALSAEDTATWLDQINEATTMTELGKVWDDATTAGVTRSAQIVTAKDKRKGELSS